MATMIGRKHYFQELSPWIQETINTFKGKDDLEFHIVAPNYASNTNLSCERDGIQYHFYHYSPLWLSVIVAPLIKWTIKHAEIFKIAERLANTLTGFRIPAKNAARIIRAIDPDLIHLYGSENPDYSAPAIQLINEYPILLTLQGYAYLQQRSKRILERKFYDFRVKYERYLNNTVEFVTTTRQVSIEEFMNNDAHMFGNCKALYYITAITKIPNEDASVTKKLFDMVYYARIDKNKGIEDLIEVISRLKSKGRFLKTLIMGRGSEAYVSQLKRLIRKKSLDETISFTGFVENHGDVYKLAAQARLMVLPTHNDGIPNSIREAMFMKLPVVANNVGGIPRFNQNKHCIHLVGLGDLDGLADGICRVLDDDDYRQEMIENAFLEAQEFYSPNAVYKQTFFAYKDVVAKTKKH